MIYELTFQNGGVCYNSDMVFSSLTFLLIFLPATLAVYFVCRNIHYRNLVLLITSLVFYAWGEPIYLLVMILVTMFVYFGAILIQSLRSRTAKKVVLSFGLALALGSLFYFKYAAFFANQILPFLGVNVELAMQRLPIGISFYTFQAISYLVDAYRGKIRVQRNYARLLLYVACFPQLIAGPIVEYADIEYELTARQTTLDEFSNGMRRFALGLCKKVLVANILGEMLKDLPAAGSSVAAAWLTSLVFAMQIYFDFSAYSDMAIGLGHVLGFRYQENFNYPYISRSVSEFWRRWHISLGRFFREYVYFPLGGSRKGRTRTTFNLLLVWTLTGLWHGASWNFVLWGFYYGILIALEHGALRHTVQKTPRILATCLTLIAVLFGWALFYQTDLSLCLNQVLAMIGLSNASGSLRFVGWIDGETILALRTYTFFPLIAAVLCLPILPWLEQRMSHRLRLQRTAHLLSTIALTVGIILCIMNLVSDSYNPFLYFRF
ncbi:MAG: MBOAT family O-acyltransferase [Eubacteriales bacterium]|nr:MBOAT family O-acyltransferase [Eubacteriales bacterium]